MAINLVLTLTLDGKDAFWNSKNTGIKLDISHLQFGARNRLTTGEESSLSQPKQYTQIQNGSKIGPDQVRIMATMPGVENYNIAEIGLWSGVPGQVGSILIAYTSVKTGSIAQMVSGIDLVFTYDMVVSTIDIDHVNIVKDTDQGSTFALLAAHETDINAHPYHLTTDSIVDNLTTDDPTKPVSARQAKILNEKMLDGSIFLNASPVDKKSQRIQNVTYTNPSNKKHLALFLAVVGSSYSSETPDILNKLIFSINDIDLDSSFYGGFLPFTYVIIPPLGRYRINWTGLDEDIIINYWGEM